jgi:hypothetical protein
MRRYKNDGRYVLGVPARDLTDEEWTALTDEERVAADDVYETHPAIAGEPGDRQEGE